MIMKRKRRDEGRKRKGEGLEGRRVREAKQ